MRLLIAFVIGYAVAKYLTEKKHAPHAEYVKTVDGIRNNIAQFIESTGVEKGDSEKIADDLVTNKIDNAKSNYAGAVGSQRYVLGSI